MSAKTPSAPRRTLPITLLAILAVIAGLSAVMDTLRLLGWLPTQVSTALGDFQFYNQNFFGALLAGLVALIWFATAGQLWCLDPRGWLFVAVIATINIIFLLMAWLGQSTFSAIALGLGINVVALVLAMLPGTKAAFGMAAPPAAARK